MIRIEKLISRRGAFCLGPIDLDFRGSSYLTILGPSGSGKTLFLETCMGLITPESGRVWLDGKDVTDIAPEQRHISYLPQDLTLFPHLSVRDNILFGARRRQLQKALVESRLANLLDLLEMHHIIDRTDVATLSGGEKQRVAMARALLPEPRLLFLDEPFSALDATIKRQLQVKLREINQQLGVTILHVTHDQEEALSMSDRIIVMNCGRVEQDGTPEDLYQKPASRFVADFIGEANLLECIVMETGAGYALLDWCGNQIKAADLLGLNRNTLRKKIRAHSIEIVKQSRRQG